MTHPNQNPLLQPWNTPYGLPPFDKIAAEHFVPAFEHAMHAHRADVDAIANRNEAPTFDNTVVAFDLCGREFSRIEMLFDNLAASETSPALQAVEREMSPRLAAHRSAIYLHDKLFAKIDNLHRHLTTPTPPEGAQFAPWDGPAALNLTTPTPPEGAQFAPWDGPAALNLTTPTPPEGAQFAPWDGPAALRGRELRLNPEQMRLLERVHLDFVREGARLSSAAKLRHAAIVERLAELSTRFSQNVLADEANYRLLLRDEADLAGLPNDLRAAAREAAQQHGENDAFAITLSRSLVVPFLTFSSRRDLREQAFNAWVRRGENDGDHDNRPVAREILALRAEQAQLHGYDNYADYALVDRMAGTPDAVAQLLTEVWEPAKARAEIERDALRATALAHGETHPIEPWDWRYYAEKVRSANYGFDDAALKPYLALDRMLGAAFDTAHRLFGLKFVEQSGIPTYHPDVRVFEVRGRDDELVGVFLSDNFARPTKRGGAWMSAYRWQSRAGGEILPIIVNNNNFAKAPAGEPTLLSADDLRTLFHEFGHGLHGLLSQVTYERLSGPQVLRDFVELPSQIFEHWAFLPEVLKRHALHHATGQPIPDELIERMERARRFNQGFEAVEYTACALVDMALHARSDAAGIDISDFERTELERIGMPREIVLRHRLPHFGHLFASAGYAAGYYVYMWAEVLDADGFDAFVEAGNPFDAAIAERLRRYVYSSGASIEPAEAFRLFRGRDPLVGAMLAQRGLVDDRQPA